MRRLTYYLIIHSINDESGFKVAVSRSNKVEVVTEKNHLKNIFRQLT